MSQNESGEWTAPKNCNDGGEEKSCKIVCNKLEEKTCENVHSCEWLPKGMTKDKKVELERKLEKAKSKLVEMSSQDCI